ncbi:hypothetical protein D3C87_1670150 [compost metagenome]
MAVTNNVSQVQIGSNRNGEWSTGSGRFADLDKMLTDNRAPGIARTPNQEDSQQHHQRRTRLRSERRALNAHQTQHPIQQIG